MLAGSQSSTKVSSFYSNQLPCPRQDLRQLDLVDRHLEVVPDDDDAHNHDDQSIGQHEPRALEKDFGNGVVVPSGHT